MRTFPPAKVNQAFHLFGYVGGDVNATNAKGQTSLDILIGGDHRYSTSSFWSIFVELAHYGAKFDVFKIIDWVAKEVESPPVSKNKADFLYQTAIKITGLITAKSQNWISQRNSAGETPLHVIIRKVVREFRRNEDHLPWSVMLHIALTAGGDWHAEDPRGVKPVDLVRQWLKKEVNPKSESYLKVFKAFQESTNLGNKFAGKVYEELCEKNTRSIRKRRTLFDGNNNDCNNNNNNSSSAKGAFKKSSEWDDEVPTKKARKAGEKTLLMCVDYLNDPKNISISSKNLLEKTKCRIYRMK